MPNKISREELGRIVENGNRYSTNATMIEMAELATYALALLDELGAARAVIDPEKLELLARFFEELYPVLRKPDGKLLSCEGNGVQRDLRRWAVDARAYLAKYDKPAVAGKAEEKR